MMEEACQELLTYGVWDGEKRLKYLVKKYLLRRKAAPEDLIFWPTGLLAAGLWQYRQEKKEKDVCAVIDLVLSAYCERWFQKGSRILWLDDLLAGETMLALYEVYRKNGPGQGIRSDKEAEQYRQAVDKAAEIAEQQKRMVDPIHHEKIDRLLDTYARRLAENMNQGYAITARVPSILIAGGSNFPVRQKEKQNRAADANMAEWRQIQGLLDKIRGTGRGGISADDPEAVQKLKSKLAGLEQEQERMKAVNAYYRKHKTLDGCPQLTPDEVERRKAAMARSWRADPHP